MQNGTTRSRATLHVLECIQMPLDDLIQLLKLFLASAAEDLSCRLRASGLHFDSLPNRSLSLLGGTVARIAPLDYLVLIARTVRCQPSIANSFIRRARGIVLLSLGSSIPSDCDENAAAATEAQASATPIVTERDAVPSNKFI